MKSLQLCLCFQSFLSTTLIQAHLESNSPPAYDLTVWKCIEYRWVERNRRALSPLACVSWLLACQGRTTARKASSRCLRTPASNDSRASKHLGEVLLCLGGIRPVCVCVYALHNSPMGTMEMEGHKQTEEVPTKAHFCRDEQGRSKCSGRTPSYFLSL